MADLFFECIKANNLPISMLLGLVVLYWSLMIFGIVGFEGLDAEIGIDADADLDAGVDGHVDGGVASDVLTFFHLGEVPLMILATFFVFVLWVCTMTTNHYWNPDWEWMTSAQFLVPNLFVSLVATKLFAMPLAPLFREMNKTEAPKVVGSFGRVNTGYLDGKFGEVAIEQDGPVIVVNAITENGQKLPRDTEVKVIRFVDETGVYIVEPVKPEKY